MKPSDCLYFINHNLRNAVFSAMCGLLLLVTPARAASPTISFNVDSFYVGSAVTLSPTVADVDADMDYVSFSVLGPGMSNWATLLPNVNVPGVGTSTQQNGVTIQKTWSPSLSGLWTVRVTAVSLNGSTSVERTLDVLAGTRMVGALTVNSGADHFISHIGEIATVENTAADSVVVQNGGTLILWSGGRVKLKPGFKASAGSFFWAAVDHDMNGYSDIEEVTDTDGDGMPDAWEVDHGLNPIVDDASLDSDGDGRTNLQEYLANTNPRNSADKVATISTGHDLVIVTPGGFYGIMKSDGSLTSVNLP